MEVVAVSSVLNSGRVCGYDTAANIYGGGRLHSCLQYEAVVMVVVIVALLVALLVVVVVVTVVVVICGCHCIYLLQLPTFRVTADCDDAGGEGSLAPVETQERIQRHSYNCATSRQSLCVVIGADVLISYALVSPGITDPAPPRGVWAIAAHQGGVDHLSADIVTDDAPQSNSGTAKKQGALPSGVVPHPPCGPLNNIHGGPECRDRGCGATHFFLVVLVLNYPTIIKHTCGGGEVFHLCVQAKSTPTSNNNAEQSVCRSVLLFSFRSLDDEESKATVKASDRDHSKKHKESYRPYLMFITHCTGIPAVIKSRRLGQL